MPKLTVQVRISIYFYHHPMPQHILFICLGNICRSCTAEEIFRTQVAAAGVSEQFCIDSAGLIDYHEGELPDIRMRQTAARHGYNLTHRSRPVSKADFERFDLIVAMDGKNRERLMQLAETPEQQNKIVMMADYFSSTAGKPSYIPDPYYGTDRDFELVITLLEDARQGLLRAAMNTQTNQ